MGRNLLPYVIHQKTMQLSEPCRLHISYRSTLWLMFDLHYPAIPRHTRKPRRDPPLSPSAPTKRPRQSSSPLSSLNRNLRLRKLPPQSLPLPQPTNLPIPPQHPLIVPRVRTYLTQNATFSPTQWKDWQTHWFTTALQGFESRLASDSRTGKFCHGDDPTFADICLAGLIQGTRAFEIEVDGIPTVERIVERCEALDAFEKAKAVHQVGFPGKKQ